MTQMLALAKAITDLVSLTATSEAEGYPASNLVDWRYPSLTWRSTDLTAQTLTIDLGVPSAHVGIYLRGANFSSITVRTNPTNSWSSPAISQIITIPLNTFVNRRQRMVYWNVNRQGVLFRYVRLEIPVQDPTDSAAYYELGCAISGVDAVEAELRVPIQISRRQAMLKNELPSRREVQRIGDPQTVLSLPWVWAWDQLNDSDDNETETMYGMAVQEDEPVIVCWNPDKPELAILALREGDISIDSSDGIGAQMPLSFIEMM